MSTIEVAKKKATILEKYLESVGVNLKHTQALEAIARVEGFKSYNVLAGLDKTEKLIADPIAFIEKQGYVIVTWPADKEEEADVDTYYWKKKGSLDDSDEGYDIYYTPRDAAIDCCLVNDLDENWQLANPLAVLICNEDISRIVIGGLSYNLDGYEDELVRYACYPSCVGNSESDLEPAVWLKYEEDFQIWEMELTVQELRSAKQTGEGLFELPDGTEIEVYLELMHKSA